MLICDENKFIHSKNSGTAMTKAIQRNYKDTKLLTTKFAF
jgi:hypothetical protein